MKDGLKLKGTVRLYDADTRELLKVVDNLLVSTGQYIVGDVLIGAEDTPVSYCALGSDNTAPAEGQTTLVVEEVRSQVTQRSRASNVITFATFFLASECGIHIYETGLFGRSTATSTPDSGSMFARALLDYDNSGTPRNLMVAWDVTITHA